MEIQYAVVPNPLQPGKYYPRPVVARTLDLEQLIIKGPTKTRLQPWEIAGVVEIIAEGIVRALLDGNRVSIDGLAEFSLRLSQVMTSPDDRFDVGNGGQLLIGAKIKPQLARSVRTNACFKKVAAPVKAPLLASFQDASKVTELLCSPGSIGTIFGHNLKIADTTDPLQGVFFVSDFDGTERNAAILQSNGHRRLVFVIPEELIGEQRLQVRTRYTARGQLRTGELDELVLPA